MGATTSFCCCQKNIDQTKQSELICISLIRPKINGIYNLPTLIKEPGSPVLSYNEQDEEQQSYEDLTESFKVEAVEKQSKMKESSAKIIIDIKSILKKENSLKAPKKQVRFLNCEHRKSIQKLNLKQLVEEFEAELIERKKRQSASQPSN